MKHQRRKNNLFLEHSISVEFNPKRKPRKTVTQYRVHTLQIASTLGTLTWTSCKQGLIKERDCAKYAVLPFSWKTPGDRMEKSL